MTVCVNNQYTCHIHTYIYNVDASTTKNAGEIYAALKTHFFIK